MMFLLTFKIIYLESMTLNLTFIPFSYSKENHTFIINTIYFYQICPRRCL